MDALRESPRRENIQSNDQAPEEPVSTAVRPMSQLNVATLCSCATVGMLAIGWCFLDSWNRQISADLFNIGNVRMMDLDQDGVPEAVAPFTKFSYPLTLAFLQFVFMGIVFLVLHFTINQERPADLRNLKLSSDKRWPMLLVTHVFSTFWLQALIMPAQMLSLGLFAASRAVEIPVTAALRPHILGARSSRKYATTIGLATVAACIMFFAYAQLAGCVCIWSGNGVALSGIAFWIISLLLLAMPAANAVCQEAIMLQPGMHPLLLLALQNIFACVLFAPVLLLFHVMGWEDVSGAFAMILTYGEVFMLVLWLCAQIAVTSALCITLIHIVDSFWTIALRALRVVLWALSMLGTFYLSSPGMPVSIACPRTSLWAFVLLCGFLLGAGAAYSDRGAVVEEDSADKRRSKPPPAQSTPPAPTVATGKSTSSASSAP